MFHLRGGEETLRSLFYTADIVLRRKLAIEMHDFGMSSLWYCIFSHPKLFTVQYFWQSHLLAEAGVGYRHLRVFIIVLLA